MAAALLSQALAPVVQALRARGQDSTGILGAQDGECAAQGKSSRGLPEIDYPVPWVVKNTFIDAGISRPLSIDGFLLEREVRSTPVSAIDGVAGLREVPFEPTVGAKRHEGRSAEPDSSSSRRSTSVGSSAAPNGLDESPGSRSEASPHSPADEVPSGASSARGSAGLPDFEYPAPLFVKNTFLDTDIGRPLSIDGFFEERLLRSCPGSALCAPPEDCQELESGGWMLPFSTPECTPMLPYCRPMSLPFSIPLPPVEPPLGAPPPPAGPPCGIPLPPAQPPVLPAELAFQAPALLPAAPAPAAAPSAPLLLLSNALGAETLGSPALPSVGSGDHGFGACKPCAHAFSAKGCRNGVQCAFCHLCPPGELQRRQKAKRVAQRKAGAA